MFFLCSSVVSLNSKPEKLAKRFLKEPSSQIDPTKRTTSQDTVAILLEVAFRSGKLRPSELGFWGWDYCGGPK